jgi:muramidase (phage lysozyme)
MNQKITHTGLTLAMLLLSSCASQADQQETVDNVDDSSQAVTGLPSCSPGRAAGVVSGKQAALLDTIAFAEGTEARGEDGYNVEFTYKYFTDCSHHPNRTNCSGKLCSTAAGRYQFLRDTWARLGYASFTPGNQARGGLKLIRQRGSEVPADRALTATEFSNLMSRASYEWASLPPGRYGQPSYSMSRMRTEYCRRAGC